MQGNDFLLLRLKQKGGLVVPSCDTITVVATTERHLRDICNLRTSPQQMLLQLQYAVLQDVELKAFSVEHAKETSVAIDNHAFLLIKIIVKVFFNLRLHHMTKPFNAKQKGKSMRHTSNKVVLFKGQ